MYMIILAIINNYNYNEGDDDDDFRRGAFQIMAVGEVMKWSRNFRLHRCIHLQSGP